MFAGKYFFMEFLAAICNPSTIEKLFPKSAFDFCVIYNKKKAEKDKEWGNNYYFWKNKWATFVFIPIILYILYKIIDLIFFYAFKI